MKRPLSPVCDHSDSKRARVDRHALHIVHTIPSDHVLDMRCSIGEGSILIFQSEEDRDLFCNRMAHYSNGRYIGIGDTMVDMYGVHRSTDHMSIIMYSKPSHIDIFPDVREYILGGSKLVLSS